MKKLWHLALFVTFAFLFLVGATLGADTPFCRPSNPASFLVGATLCRPSDPAYGAKKKDDIGEQVNEEVEKGLEDLIGSDFEEYFKDIGVKNSAGSLKSLLKDIIAGKQAFDINLLTKTALNSLTLEARLLIPAFIAIIGISILMGMLKKMTSGFMNAGTVSIINFVTVSVMLALILGILTDAILSTVKAVNTIAKIADITVPLMLTLTTALGGTASASVYSTASVGLSNIVIRIVTGIIIPLFIASVVTTLVGSVSKSIKLDKLTATLISTGKWLLGAVFGIFTTFVISQGLVGASVDNVSVRSLKFALSGYVPILGGYLSDGFDIISASCILIKNAVGLVAVIMLFTAILAPVAKLIVLSLCLKITASVTEPLGADMSGVMFKLSKSIGLLISAILGVAFAMFSIFILMISTMGGGV